MTRRRETAADNTTGTTGEIFQQAEGKDEYGRDIGKIELRAKNPKIPAAFRGCDAKVGAMHNRGYR